MIEEIYGTVVNVILSNNMPYAMPEHLVENADGSYTIFLNAKLNYETQRIGHQHAADHILDQDFDKRSVQTIESAAHSPKHVESMAEDEIIELVKELLGLSEKDKINALLYD